MLASVTTPDTATCDHCGRPLLNPRPGQRFCPSPSQCRHEWWMHHDQAEPHKCRCGGIHVPDGALAAGPRRTMRIQLLLWVRAKPTRRQCSTGGCGRRPRWELLDCELRPDLDDQVVCSKTLRGYCRKHLPKRHAPTARAIMRDAREAAA